MNEKMTSIRNFYYYFYLQWLKFINDIFSIIFSTHINLYNFKSYPEPLLKKIRLKAHIINTFMPKSQASIDENNLHLKLFKIGTISSFSRRKSVFLFHKIIFTWIFPYYHLSPPSIMTKAIWLF